MKFELIVVSRRFHKESSGDSAKQSLLKVPQLSQYQDSFSLPVAGGMVSEGKSSGRGAALSGGSGGDGWRKLLPIS